LLPWFFIKTTFLILHSAATRAGIISTNFGHSFTFLAFSPTPMILNVDCLC
jgi:hypothetical protein